jgi:hypothetical protein
MCRHVVVLKDFVCCKSGSVAPYRGPGFRQKGLDNMKQISTGAGLVALAVGMVATALFATHRDSTQASAQSTERTAVDQSEIDIRSRSSAASGSTVCEDAALNWLSQTPQLITYCSDLGSIGLLNIGVADLNGDGQAENFTRPNALHYPVYQGQIKTSDAARVYRCEIEILSGGTRTVRYSRVLDTSQVGYWLRERFPSCFQVELLAQGWADVDGDGDLDLVGHVAVDLGQGGSVNANIWFENTGFQSSAPNPYDLDQDGEVGASDISVLLLNYSK